MRQARDMFLNFQPIFKNIGNFDPLKSFLCAYVWMNLNIEQFQGRCYILQTSPCVFDQDSNFRLMGKLSFLEALNLILYYQRKKIKIIFEAV